MTETERLQRDEERRTAASLPFWIAVAAVAGVALVGAFLWRSLPAVNQDELLPLLPLTEFTKEPEARSSLLAAYSRTIAGQSLPVLAYPYEGAAQAYLFLALRIPTSPPAVRLFHLAVFAAAAVLLLAAAWRLCGGDRLAVLACLGLLLTDLPLVVLGMTGLGRSDFLFAAGLLFLLAPGAADLRRPRWILLGFVVFLGVWQKASHLWFPATVLTGLTLAAAMDPVRRRFAALGRAVLGVGLGLLAVGLLVPDYASRVGASASANLSAANLDGAVEHASLLFSYLDPFSAYHRYVDVAAGRDDPIYTAWRWTTLGLTLATIVALLVLALSLRRRRGAAAARSAFALGCLGAMPLLLLLTRETWAAHHVLAVRAFLYLGLAVVAATLAGWTRRTVLVGLAGLAVLSGAVGARGVRDLGRAPQIPGFYNVSHNAGDAWRYAAASGVPTIFALDWGVFYPGVVNSPDSQRWEMANVPDPAALDRLRAQARGERIGLLLKTRGQHRWVRDMVRSGRTRVQTERRFGLHPGEEWLFLEVDASRWRRSDGPVEVAAGGENLLRNPAFAQGESFWRVEAWESRAKAAAISVVDCPVGAARPFCAELRHAAEADTRFVQRVRLEAERLYEISGMARADRIGSDGAGAHLGLMEFYGLAESEKLVGTTGWQRLVFFVFSGSSPQEVQLAARLGTFGGPNVGTAWFTDLGVRPVDAAPRGAPVFELDAPR